VDAVSDPLLHTKSGSARNRTRISGSVAGKAIILIHDERIFQFEGLS
jgi:hypothetical protein